MRTLILLVFVLAGTCFAQDKPQTSAPTTSLAQDNVAASDKPIEKTKPAPPAHATFTAEESAQLRVKLLRLEKLRLEQAQQIKESPLQKQIEKESDALNALFTEFAAKYGIKPDAIKDYDVINGDSSSDKDILLKRKAEEKKPEPPKK